MYSSEAVASHRKSVDVRFVYGTSFYNASAAPAAAPLEARRQELTQQFETVMKARAQELAPQLARTFSSAGP